MTRGFGTKEALLGCFVVLAAGGILIGMGLLATRRRGDDVEAQRMRRLYLALANYEAGFDGVDAPSLAELRPFVADPGDYVSSRDPYAKTRARFYPNDGGRPDGPRRSVQRISDTYLWAYPEAARRAGRSGFVAQKDLLMGILSNEWCGSVRSTGDFGAEVSGPVLRITLDGSLYRTTDRDGPKPLGSFDDLFVRR